MKCELCRWQEKPESTVSMARHIGTYHQDLVPHQIVVWRDGEIVHTTEYDGEEQLISVDVKKVHPLIKPEILKQIDEVEKKLVTESVEDYEDSPQVIDLDEEPE